jgi:hypothetical protein
MGIFRSRRAASSKSADDPAPGRGNGSPDALARIDELVGRNRERRDPETERELIAVRHAAFAELARDDPRPAAAAPSQDLTLEQGVPVIAQKALTAEAARAAILTYGCVHVPGLLDPETAARLAAGIDRTFEAYDAAGKQTEAGNDRDAWYVPFQPLPGYRRLGVGRKFNRDSGAIWAADSPRSMFEVLEVFDRVGIRDLITGYFGERPAISVNKSVLRRVSPKTSGADWHQDGAFLGEDIRSLNVWLTLSRCGDVAPGMDVVPVRLEQIVETGTEGANFDWSVSPAAVERVAGDGGVVRPVFEAGDALLFDHMFMHRTASDPAMSRERYALETWFFAPSAYPDDQLPLVF